MTATGTTLVRDGIQYFIRTTKDQWQEVDEYVFNNRTLAVTSDPDEMPLYSENYIVKESDGNIIFGGKVTIKEVGRVARFLGVRIPTDVMGDFLATPETVKIKRKGKGGPILHNTRTQENWKLA